LGINLLVELAKRATAILGDQFDIEIVEKHHNQKIDAPSGTAMALADAINQAMEERYHYVYDRSQVREKREKTEERKEAKTAKTAETEKGEKT